MAGLPLRRYKCLVHNALENERDNDGHVVVYKILGMVLFHHRISNFHDAVCVLYLGRFVGHCNEFAKKKRVFSCYIKIVFFIFTL